MASAAREAYAGMSISLPYFNQVYDRHVEFDLVTLL